MYVLPLTVTYFATTISHFARCIKPNVKLFSIHHFLRRLLAGIILITGHMDFITGF